MSYDKDASTIVDLTSLTEAVTATDEVIVPLGTNASDTRNQLVIQGLVASGNTFNASLRDKPYGADFANANAAVDLARQRSFSTHMETVDTDIDGDGVLEPTPNDYETETGTLTAKRSFLLTGLDKNDDTARTDSDYNCSTTCLPNYNVAVLVGRGQLQRQPAPLFSPAAQIRQEEKR